MSEPIWKKDDGAAGPSSEVMDFLAGEDVRLDRELIRFDIEASQAHVLGLRDIGVLDEQEAAQLVEALGQIARELAAGERVLDERFEDGHSALESWLTEQLGALGGKVHTGRSRNDQVAVALRLYLKDRLRRLAMICLAIAGAALERARIERDWPMPGYTHLQRAMPSSVGLWTAGHAEAFIDNAELALGIRAWLDASPLGTASGFGVNLPLPRQVVAERLGFARLQINPQYAQNSRGKIELQALSALSAATGDLRRLAWDLSLFTTSEFGFLRLADQWCTGSSIMPNKRNPDAVELLRAAHAVVAGARTELDAALSLPSGYQRDLQATKPPLLRAFKAGLQALSLVPDLLAGLEWDRERLRQAISADMYATDLAQSLTLEGVPFREAYRRAAAQIEEQGRGDPEASIAARVSPGACGDLLLEELKARLDRLQSEA